MYQPAIIIISVCSGKKSNWFTAAWASLEIIYLIKSPLIAAIAFPEKLRPNPESFLIIIVLQAQDNLPKVQTRSLTCEDFGKFREKLKKKEQVNSVASYILVYAHNCLLA